MKTDVIVFDGSNAAHRLASTHPPLTNSRGERVEVMFGLLRLLSAVLRENPAADCHVVWDGSGSKKIRQKVDPVYKIHRGDSPEDKEKRTLMYAQVEDFWTNFGQFLPIHWHTSHKYEADDIMAMLAAVSSKVKRRCLVVTGDRDLLQVVDKYVSIYSPSGNKYCTVDNFKEYTKGYPHPRAWLAAKCLMGEPANGDNVPGIRGCGEVSALKILSEHNFDLAELLTNPNEALQKSKLGQAILCDAGRDRLAKNVKLMSLFGKCHQWYQSHDIEYRMGSLNKMTVRTNLARHQFASILANFTAFIQPFQHLETTSDYTIG